MWNRNDVSICDACAWLLTSTKTGFGTGLGLVWWAAVICMVRSCFCAELRAYVRVATACVILPFFGSLVGIGCEASAAVGMPLSISLSYMPTFGGVSDFKIGNAYYGDTRALVPYTQGDGTHVLRSDHFDWLAMGDKISFENSSKAAITGSVGLKLRGGQNWS